jgi:hypothetical protein
MRWLASLLVVVSVWSSPVLAQATDQDRSVERIRLALQQPPPLVSSPPPPGTTGAPVTFGPFTLVPPVLRGEMVRISFPIGEFVSRAFDGVAGWQQRRKETAARRDVIEALKDWEAERTRVP